MTRSKRIITTCWLSSLTAACFLMLGGAAEAQVPTVTLRAYALHPDLSIDEGIHAANFLRSQLGFGIDAEVRPEEHWGLDLSLGAFRVARKSVQTLSDENPPEIFETRGSIRAIPALLGVYLHPWPLTRVDVYGGPVLGLMVYQGDFQSRHDNEAAFGGVLGFDVPFSHRWAAGASARFLHTRFPSIEEVSNEVVNTVQFMAGVSYRW